MTAYHDEDENELGRQSTPMTSPDMPAMDEKGLRNCPFCGSPASLEHDSDHHGEWFNLGCSRHWEAVADDEPSCPGGRLWYTAGLDEEADAIAAWNRRAYLAATAREECPREIALGEDEMPERIWAGDFDAQGFGHCVAGMQGGLYAEYVRADRSSLKASQEAEVVKALEWEERGGSHYADSALGECVIDEDGDGFYVIENGRKHSEFATADDAKAFVQKNHNRWVYGYLATAQPSPDAEVKP